jgi:hypothetical protein
MVAVCKNIRMMAQNRSRLIWEVDDLGLDGRLLNTTGVEPISPGYNPATWMLEVTGGAVSVGAKAVDVSGDSHCGMEYEVTPLAAYQQGHQHVWVGIGLQRTGLCAA